MSSTKQHVGMKLALKNIIHSIKCDESKKYTRYFSIAFLPAHDGLGSCVLVGCLEVSKEDEKEFYNPSKFYSPETMKDALLHMMASYMAFEAVTKNRELHSVVHSFLNSLYGEASTRNKITSLAKSYYDKFKNLL